jgi:hypothetical protein
MKNKNLYIILGLLGVGGLIWYFKRKQTTTTTSENQNNNAINFDINSILPTKQTNAQNVVLDVQTAPITVNTNLDNVNTMFTNYNVWLNQLIENRRATFSKFGPVTFQPTKETQPLPSDASGNTIPLIADYVFVWQEIDTKNTIGDNAKIYSKRWILINKNQIS